MGRRHRIVVAPAHPATDFGRGCVIGRLRHRQRARCGQRAHYKASRLRLAGVTPGYLIPEEALSSCLIA
jgi:hypothetical protein